VDVVFSFETLEHITDQEKFFREVKRVLNPDDVLVMSTSNVEVYGHQGADRNPFHVKELNAVSFLPYIISRMVPVKVIIRARSSIKPSVSGPIPM
jgi:O-antigen biosynthesis protein